MSAILLLQSAGLIIIILRVLLNSVSQGGTATPVHKEQKADDEQYHEEIIVADHDILH